MQQQNVLIGTLVRGERRLSKIQRHYFSRVTLLPFCGRLTPIERPFMQEKSRK